MKTAVFSPVRWVIRLTALLVILSIAGFSAASLVTLHYHVLANGLVVVHSHPLPDNNHRNTHKHSRQQYAELNAASQVLQTMVLVPVLDLAVAEYSCGKVSLDPVSIPVFEATWYISKRGPPSISFS